MGKFMKICIYSNKRLAQKFIFVSDMIEYFCANQKTELNFSLQRVKTNDSVLCGCFGSLMALVFNKTDSDFLNGGNALAQYLGFITMGQPDKLGNGTDEYQQLKLWAKRNPEIWGSEHGNKMFSEKGYKAFNKKSDNIHLLDIADHFKKVANNLVPKPLMK